MKYFFTLVGSVIGLAVLAWFLLTYVLISDERKVLRTIEKARCSVESGSVLTLAGLLAANYHHENGMDRSEAIGALQELFHQTKNLRVTLLHSSVRVNGDRAEAQVNYLLTGLEDRSLPEFENQLTDPEGKGRTVEMAFIREGHSWLIERTSLH